MQKYDKTALLILDGWGISPDKKVSAIDQAKTPFINSLYQEYPNAQLITHGEKVGLPTGQMGNSEVGHLNIGAGRVVYQQLARINLAIQDGSFHKNKVLVEALQHAKQQHKKVHLMGLVSDGGVHSHLNHLKALCDVTQSYDLDQVYIHAFMDGRDTSPTAGVGYLNDLQNHIQDTPVQIASLIGRYYAMDRDNRWERIKLAYDLLTKGEGTQSANPVEALKTSYQEDVTDEFLPPISCVKEGIIERGDVVICFNFRTDRCRQISLALTQKDFPDYQMQKLDIHYSTMTRYDASFDGISVLFEKDNLKNTLGEVLAKANKTQVRIAETEKYPHVTFFFSGGQEEQFEGEKRLMAASPKVATYDLQPTMSAHEITTKIIQEIQDHQPNFICLNYANADMVGHTGVFEAAITAAETVDNCTQKVVDQLLKKDYAVLIIADHGNSDCMINPDGSANTAHTTNPVPCFLVTNEKKNYLLKDGKLGDIAPTILHLMHIVAPAEMTGDILIQ